MLHSRRLWNMVSDFVVVVANLFSTLQWTQSHSAVCSQPVVCVPILQSAFSVAAPSA